MVGPTEAVKGDRMSNVVSIDIGKFLGDYISRQKGSGILEHGLFLLGVLAVIVVPQVMYCVNGGLVSPWLFVVSAQTGVILGLAKIIWPAAVVTSVVDTQTKRVSQDDRTKRRKSS
jgi:hypothetical protein